MRTNGKPRGVFERLGIEGLVLGARKKES